MTEIDMLGRHNKEPGNLKYTYKLSSIYVNVILQKIIILVLHHLYGSRHHNGKYMIIMISKIYNNIISTLNNI